MEQVLQDLLLLLNQLLDQLNQLRMGASWLAVAWLQQLDASKPLPLPLPLPLFVPLPLPDHA